MSVPIRKVSKAVQAELDALPTTYKKIKYLQKEGWKEAEVARFLNLSSYQHAYNEFRRYAKQPR